MSRSILVLCAVLTMAGAAPASDRTDVVKFLKDHVVGKTLTTPSTTSKGTDGKFEETYEDQVTFGNLVETEDGATFDVTVKAKQVVYELDKDGKRIMPGRDQSGTTVFRYELVERKSTHKLMGYWRVLSTTMKDRTPVGTVATVHHPQVSDGQLTWKESQAGYGDTAAEKGKFKPGAYSSVSKLSVVDGKLQWYWEQVNYDVDPETLKRTPTKDVIPATISKELDKR
jgi:hypothetical protein